MPPKAERQCIARDLHDDIGQSLTAIGLGLRSLKKTIESCSESAVAAQQVFPSLEEILNQSLEGLQRTIADLRPSHLDDLGLPAALRWYAGLLEERSGLKISVQIRGAERDLAPSVKIALFRVAQEALNNILKHAQARRVRLTLEFSPQNILLSVRDDGRGFDTQTVCHQHGKTSLGLLGMEERSGLLGGKFFLQSWPDAGTLVEVQVPYQPIKKANPGDDSNLAGR